jgi:hypothetical protein
VGDAATTAVIDRPQYAPDDVEDIRPVSTPRSQLDASPVDPVSFDIDIHLPTLVDLVSLIKHQPQAALAVKDNSMGAQASNDAMMGQSPIQRVGINPVRDEEADERTYRDPLYAKRTGGDEGSDCKFTQASSVAVSSASAGSTVFHPDSSGPDALPVTQAVPGIPHAIPALEPTVSSSLPAHEVQTQGVPSVLPFAEAPAPVEINAAAAPGAPPAATAFPAKESSTQGRHHHPPRSHRHRPVIPVTYSGVWDDGYVPLPELFPPTDDRSGATYAGFEGEHADATATEPEADPLQEIKRQEDLEAEARRYLDELQAFMRQMQFHPPGVLYNMMYPPDYDRVHRHIQAETKRRKAEEESDRARKKAQAIAEEEERIRRVRDQYSTTGEGSYIFVSDSSESEPEKRGDPVSRSTDRHPVASADEADADSHSSRSGAAPHAEDDNEEEDDDPSDSHSFRRKLHRHDRSDSFWNRSSDLGFRVLDSVRSHFPKKDHTMDHSKEKHPSHTQSDPNINPAHGGMGNHGSKKDETQTTPVTQSLAKSGRDAGTPGRKIPKIGRHIRHSVVDAEQPLEASAQRTSDSDRNISPDSSTTDSCHLPLEAILSNPDLERLLRDYYGPVLLSLPWDQHTRIGGCSGTEGNAATEASMALKAGTSPLTTADIIHLRSSRGTDTANMEKLEEMLWDKHRYFSHFALTKNMFLDHNTDSYEAELALWRKKTAQAQAVSAAEEAETEPSAETGSHPLPGNSK